MLNETPSSLRESTSTYGSFGVPSNYRSRNATQGAVRGSGGIGAFVVLLIATAVFWRTAYPTITWWDSSGYSLAAGTLGIYTAPGSLLLTLLGWPITRLAGGSSAARALNLCAGVIAALTVTVVYLASLCALRAAAGDGAPDRSRASVVALYLGVSCGALTLAWSSTLWTYAVMFTPYILSALFTALILWTMLRWWQDANDANAWRWVAVLGLEFGLDFSVHRTNALLIPCAIAWVLLRQPRTFRSIRSIGAGIAGLLLGLSAQLALIPIAAHSRSPLDFNRPDTLSGLWDYVRLKQLGGGFLLDILPRKAPFWHVQTMDLLRVLGDNFLRWRGGLIVGILPTVAALIGLVWLWRRDRRLGAAFTILLLLQSLFTVLYFDIPANFFRTFDRHYLPVCVSISILICCGLGVTGRWIALQLERRSASLALGAAVPALAIVPLSQLAVDWSTHDASRRYFTHDYVVNVLRTLPPHAIYFTVGDNDTFPVWYVQSVEGLRPDVTTINLSVANVPEWPERQRRRDPALRLTLRPPQRDALTSREWTDTTLVLPVQGTPAQFDLDPETRLPSSLTLHVHPASGDRMLPAEVVLLDIVRSNEWRRPLTFAVTGTRNAMEWLAPYGRLDGLYYRTVPVTDPKPNATLLRANLLHNAVYRGYADASVKIDDVSRIMGLQPYAGGAQLLSADEAAHDLNRCRADQRAFITVLPPSRLTAPTEFLDPIASACEPLSASQTR